MSVFVIGEAGSCHDGLLGKAVALLDVAKDAGADACKFQYWSDAAKLAARRRAPQAAASYEKYRLPPAWLPGLKAECERREIEFMCTVYLPEDIEVVAPYVRRFKIASFESADETFVDAHWAYGKSVLVSLGMGTTPVRGAYNLHCVSAYPAPLEQANLKRLWMDGIHGFSDHTANPLTGMLAVGAGAEILEVHIRDWGTATDNPDYSTALDPKQFAEYVSLVRLAEAALGDGTQKVMPAEAPLLQHKVLA